MGFISCAGICPRIGQPAFEADLVMRVIFNQTSTVGMRTGVGHCAWELLQHLQCLSGVDVNGFPSQRWLTWEDRLKRLDQSLFSMRRRLKGSRWLFPLSIVRGLAARLRDHTVRRYERWRDELFHEAFFGTRFDLYHEPNFIPYDSSLPTVTTLHDLSALLYPHWHPAERVTWFTENLPNTLRASAHFIVVSHFTRRQVMRHLHVPPQRVTCVHNGPRPGFRPLPSTHVAQTLQRLGLPSRYLLYLGTIEPRKNVLRLMQAYCALPESLREQWPLLLAGAWGWGYAAEHKYYEEEARHRGVRHIGYVSDADLPSLCNGARALLYPSLYEGFGLPPLEMLACGGAVLASHIEPIVEVVGNQGHLIAPEDVGGWHDALKRVVCDDDWWHHLRDGAEARAQTFSWQRAAQETYAVYRRVLDAKQGSLPLPLRIAA